MEMENKMIKFNYEKVKDPEYFKEGCVSSCSDHQHYRDHEEMEEGTSTFIHMLNGIWKFHYARNYNETITGFEKEEYECKNWEDIRVPAHIQLEGYDQPQYVNIQYPWEGREEIIPGEIPERLNPVASYVKYFEIPKQMRKERVFLSLEGAESAAAVWLNGNFIGYHEDSFTPARFELTSYIKESGENKLAVQVFKWCAGSWCEDQDFFRFSGLYRDVYLYSIPSVHIEDIHLQGNPSEDLRSAEFIADLKIKGKGNVHLLLKDHGQTIYEHTKNAEGEVRFSTKIDHPSLWSSEVPYLYDCEIEVFDGNGVLLECIGEKVGFRRFEIKDSVMCLNGKRIVFNGVNRHEFSSISGRNVSKEELIKDLKTMKRNNINAVRTSHYPNSSFIYQLCDIFGIYLIDEVNLETHGTWDGIVSEEEHIERVLPGNRKEWKGMLLERASSMYERDKNHPSILIWSCGNESYGGSVIYEMSQYFRKQDKTRIVHYEGIYNDRSYPDTSDMESQMYTPADEIRKFLKKNRTKPFLCCEYAHAMGNSCGALYKYTDLTEKERLYQGGFIWDYIDQTLDHKTRYGEEFQAYGGDFQDRPTDYNFSGNGIVYGGTRNPSPKMQEVKYLYQNIKIQVYKDQVKIKNKNLFSNTNQKECRVTVKRNGKEIEHCMIDTAVEPLSEAVYLLPIRKRTKQGEYTITVSFHLKEDQIWAEKGYETDFGEYVYQIREEDVCLNTPPVKVVRSRHNIGIYSEQFSTLFSLQSGGLVSYQYGGKEMLSSIPKPNFWRAPTDNDCGCMMQSRHAQWKIASLYASTKKQTEDQIYPDLTPYSLKEFKDHAQVCFCYHLPTIPESSCKVIYDVYGDGTVCTELIYDQVKDLPDMPEFGMLFKMDADYDNLTWYGLGPEETYADRKCGAKLGVYKNKVKDNMASYIVPQECGNKEGVRYAKVTDKKGRGLFFQAEDETMSFSALPYTPHQMEEAMHFYELPKVYHTVIRVAKAQMGVGGDNSWGAKTHNEFRIEKSGRLVFRFCFKGI